MLIGLFGLKVKLLEFDKRGNNVTLICSNGKHVGVLEMLCPLISTLPWDLLLTRRFLLWQALCRVSPLSVATSHPRSENYAHALCHSTANHRLVPAPTGIESLDSFASVTNAQHLRVWSTSQSFITGILLGIPQTRLDFPDSQDPTRNTTDKVRLSGSS